MISFAKKNIGVDLGTSNTIVVLHKEGIVSNEPTVVAISVEDKKVVAVGTEAKEMLGKVPGNIIAKKPLKSGVIASYKLTQALLSYFLDKALGKSRFIRPDVMISVPAGITTVEERAVVEACISSGASRVNLIPEPLAAAIGAGLPISTSSGNMIVNLGGGTTEVAVISMNGVVTFNSARVGGDDINDAIVSYLKRKYNLLIGELMAEQVKMTIGSAIEADEDIEMDVSGRDIAEGMPKIIKVKSNEITAAIRPVLNEIIAAIKKVLEKTPPELASDVIDRGMVLSGGGAKLKRLDELLAKATGVVAVTAEDPELCVARGIQVALGQVDMVRRNLR